MRRPGVVNKKYGLLQSSTFYGNDLVVPGWREEFEDQRNAERTKSEKSPVWTTDSSDKWVRAVVDSIKDLPTTNGGRGKKIAGIACWLSGLEGTPLSDKKEVIRLLCKKANCLNKERRIINAYLKG
jgi:hypothetical protein